MLVYGACQLSGWCGCQPGGGFPLGGIPKLLQNDGAPRENNLCWFKRNVKLNLLMNVTLGMTAEEPFNRQVAECSFGLHAFEQEFTLHSIANS